MEVSHPIMKPKRLSFSNAECRRRWIAARNNRKIMWNEHWEKVMSEMAAARLYNRRVNLQPGQGLRSTDWLELLTKSWESEAESSAELGGEDDEWHEGHAAGIRMCLRQLRRHAESGYNGELSCGYRRETLNEANPNKGKP